MELNKPWGIFGVEVLHNAPWMDHEGLKDKENSIELG